MWHPVRIKLSNTDLLAQFANHNCKLLFTDLSLVVAKGQNYVALSENHTHKNSLPA